MPQDIYVAGFSGIPKGSEAATWNQISRLQKPQPALRDPGEDDLLSLPKMIFMRNPKGAKH
jgi:hypothetical protein